ncbi:MAG: LLM class flavin-dependent oxidoreductase, partial [Bacteroidetes bacterium]|nr:LLM class flavin-dependent oxidoreductase [Bacteroidota bacterium]
GYQRTFTRIGRERGWGPVTRAQFDALTDPRGALVIGSPEEVADKMLRHAEALGGLAEFRLHMNVAELSHEQLMNADRLLGEEVAPRVRKATS